MGPSSPDILRDRKRVAGGDGRNPDAVEVVGEERSEHALRLKSMGENITFSQSAHVIGLD